MDHLPTTDAPLARNRRTTCPQPMDHLPMTDGALVHNRWTTCPQVGSSLPAVESAIARSPIRTSLPPKPTLTRKQPPPYCPPHKWAVARRWLFWRRVPIGSRTHHSMTEVLDIDEPATWHEDFRELLYAQAMWSRICEKIGGDELAALRFYEQITCNPGHLRDPLARILRETAKKILESRYAFTMACHGCRVVDRTSYATSGIMPSDTKALIEMAR